MRFIDEYHILYEKAKIWEETTWFGIPMWKLPSDAIVLQELIYRLRPEVIIETGTGCGGSAMFYASICELMGQGNVITCDIEIKADYDKINLHHWADRIKFVSGGSTNALTYNEIIEVADEWADKEEHEQLDAMVILDSWHTHEHVYDEMCLYSTLVDVGGYMVVEDSHANGNPVPWKWDDEGPMGAINQWMREHRDEWEVDWKCEKHLMTFNPKGYLRRIK